LGGNLKDIVAEWKDITSKGIDIRILDMPLIDTTLHRDLLGNYINEVIIQLFTYILDQDKEKLRKKQAKGILDARNKGVILGRPKAQLPDNFNQIYFRWKSTQITAVEAMKQLGLKKSTFYKLIKQYEENFKKSKLGSQ
jgi:DNA invertase Pin-like site-specific DNA recombinase